MQPGYIGLQPGYIGLQPPSHTVAASTTQERKLLLMDTSQQHRTHNGGESDRYILMLNVLRPQVN